MNTAHGFTQINTDKELKYKETRDLIENSSLLSAVISELINPFK